MMLPASFAQAWNFVADALRLNRPREMMNSPVAAVIRTVCPNCGEVNIAAGRIVLTVFEDGKRGSYAFVCPTCQVEIEKPADRKIIDLLVKTAVMIEALGIDTSHDWNVGFITELSCNGTHKWDLPVVGQQCVCGEKLWGEL